MASATIVEDLEQALAEVPIIDIHTHLIGGKLAARGLHDVLLYHMVISDLYAAGYFTTAGGSAAYNIAKWDGSSWTALGSGMNSRVNALAVSGSELDFSDTPIAILGENLLLLRYVELQGRIHRILSVLKMRDSTYDNDLREFEITDEGIRVLAPLRSVKGLLTGQAHPIGSSVDEEIH